MALRPNFEPYGWTTSPHAKRTSLFRLRSVPANREAPQPIRRVPLYELVADELRGLIEAEGLELGDRLPGERDLALRLGVSRHSLRQGLTVLRVMGLVEIRHGTGIYLLRSVTDVVPPISIESVEDASLLSALSDVREVLETHAAQMAARCRTAADLAEAAHAIVEMETEIAAGKPGVEGDRRFHAALITAAHNPVLADILARMQPSIRLISRTSLERVDQPPRSLATHRLIFEAVARQDEEEAGRLMRGHLAVTGALSADVAHLR